VPADGDSSRRSRGQVALFRPICLLGIFYNTPYAAIIVASRRENEFRR